MSETPSAAEGSSPAAPKRATTRRRASAARRVTKTTTRKKATAKKATAKATAGATTAKRRGRPPGSRNKRTTKRATAAVRATPTNPADAMSKRISDLINENRSLKARVNELEAGWKKIEKAFGTEVQKARRTVKRTTRSAARKVEAAISAVTP